MQELNDRLNVVVLHVLMIEMSDDNRKIWILSYWKIQQKN